MAKARHHADGWRSDFEKLSGSFAIFTLLDEDFARRADWPTLADYDRWASRAGALTADGHPVRFALQPPRPRRRAKRLATEVPYEQQVISGTVPTRLGHWHDFFNAAAWALFPKTKAALNLRQVREGFGASRTPEQNRLAMFDEGGIARLQTPDGVRELVVGHALHEGVMRGQVGLCGMTVDVGVAVEEGAPLASLVAEADAWLGSWISRGGLAPASAQSGVERALQPSELGKSGA